VEVRSEGEGIILMRKIPSLKKIQKKMSGRLPAWSELEGKADGLVLRETRKEKHQPE
jgi:hypothetical protein